jgi:methylmalonyl-CoA/ethylmalonyl-CoA epimerase
MLENFRFHHIGYATYSITETESVYIKAGYNATEITIDSIQRVKVCFLAKSDFPCIELVEPMDESASVNKILKKNGVSPYHLCYEVDDIDDAFDALVALEYTPLFRPVEAAALDNRKICYFYKKEIGFIEIVQMHNTTTPTDATA